MLKYKSRNSSKIYFNDKLEQITGYSLNDFYTNKISFVDLYHSEDKEMAKRAIYIALKTRSTYTIKSRIIHKSGKIVTIEEYGGTIVINNRIAYIEGVVIAVPENE